MGRKKSADFLSGFCFPVHSLLSFFVCWVFLRGMTNFFIFCVSLLSLWEISKLSAAEFVPETPDMMILCIRFFHLSFLYDITAFLTVFFPLSCTVAIDGMLVYFLCHLRAPFSSVFFVYKLVSQVCASLSCLLEFASFCAFISAFFLFCY